MPSASAFRADQPWLIVIDMQRIFGEPASPWHVPGFGQVHGKIDLLRHQFGNRVIFTRFVPPAAADGSWRAYYEKWPFAMAGTDDPHWQLTGPWQAEPTLDVSCFSKWNPELAGVVGDRAHLVLCGVTTDCCVLATCFAAIDHGATVTVVTDACAAIGELHQAALRVLADRDPQVRLTTSAQIMSTPPC